MRVALCLSGYLRSLQYNTDSWNKYLLNQTDVTFDWFVHSWDRADCYGPESYIDNIMHLNKFNIKKISIESPITFPQSELVKARANNYVPQNALSQFYSLEKVFELKKKHEEDNGFKYDCAIRFRPDIYLREILPINKTLDMNKVHIPKYGDFHGINDQVAYSNSDNMNLYSKIFSNIEKYLSSTPELTMCTEMMVKFHCDKNNFELERHSVLYQLARDNGKFLPDNKTREIGFGYTVQ